MPIDKLGELVKDKYMGAMKIIKTLSNVDKSIRNTDAISNAYLEDLMKVCVKNSLVPMMVKLKKGKVNISQYKQRAILEVNIE